MAQYNRPPKTKSAKADEFLSFFDRLIRYFLIHQKKFYSLVAAVVLFFAGYGIYLYKVNREVNHFAMDYWQAQKSPESQESKGWQGLLQKNPPAQLAELIRLQWGGEMAKNQRWAEAAAAFQGNMQARSPLLMQVSQWAYATSLENAGEFQKAHDVYQSLANQKEGIFVSEGRLGMARSLAGMGESNESETILIQLIAKDSEAPQAIKSAALNRLIVMKLKTPVPDSVK